MKLANRNLTIVELKELIEVLKNLKEAVIYSESIKGSGFLCFALAKEKCTSFVRQIITEEITTALYGHTTFRAVVIDIYIRKYGRKSYYCQTYKEESSVTNQYRISLLKLWISQATRYLNLRTKKVEGY